MKAEDAGEGAVVGECAGSANARVELKKQLWADAEDDDMDFDDLGELQRLGQALQVSPPSSPALRRRPTSPAEAVQPPPPPAAPGATPAGWGEGVYTPPDIACTPAGRGDCPSWDRPVPGAPQRYPNKLLQCLVLPDPTMPGESLWATSAKQDPPPPQHERTWGDAQWCVAVALSNTAGFALSRTALQEKLRWDENFAPSLGAFGNYLHRNNRLFKYDKGYVHFSPYLYQMRADHDAMHLTPTPGPASSAGTPHAYVHTRAEREPAASAPVPPPPLPVPAATPVSVSENRAVSTPPKAGVEVDMSRCVAVSETGRVKVDGRIRLRKQARATCRRYTGIIACGDEVELVLKRRDRAGNEFSLCVSRLDGAQGFVRTEYLEMIPHKVFPDTQKLAESIIAATQPHSLLQ